jgi:hypothetical protein
MARPNLLQPFDGILYRALVLTQFRAARWAIEKGVKSKDYLTFVLNKAIEMGDTDFRDYLIVDKRVRVSYSVLKWTGMCAF